MPETLSAPLMLSVSGARGIVGRSMTPPVAAEYAAAFGTLLNEQSDGAPLVCLGRDSRPSGAMLAAAARAGLTATGCAVVDVGLAATPSVGVMIDTLGADGGMVVTASHNPRPWNGLKCLLSGGVAPSAEAAARIIDRFRRRDLLYVEVGNLEPARCESGVHETHVRSVLDQVRREPIRQKGFRVVLDSVNGAGGPAGSMLLETLGCELVHINAEPTGNFAHDPEPTEANLRGLAAKTATANAAVGFAQDPDADRLAIIDEQGRYIGEECTLVLAARRMLQLREPGSEPAIIVTNLSTSRMIDDVAAAAGARVIRTAVGEANVAAAMVEHDALLGGEGNGGVIVPSVCLVRDSLSAMAFALDLLAAEDRPLSAIIEDFPRYAMVKRKMGLDDGDDLRRRLDRVATHFAAERVSTIDGVRIDFADGWVHLRPSNTEPIFRAIGEAATEGRANELVEMVLGVAG